MSDPVTEMTTTETNRNQPNPVNETSARQERLSGECNKPQSDPTWSEVHQSEQKLTESLREQLDRARKDKANLEADLETRAKAFQAKLNQLQAGSSDRISRLDHLLSLENTNEIKQEIKKLHETCISQEARIKKLEFDLETEQGHVNILRHDNQMLRQMTVDMTVLAEQEEEYISNKLLKRISGLKKEKGELLVQVEQEEEYLTNMLQKRLNQLQKEKIDMENALEQEQEYIVNKLQKQLDSLRAQQPMKSPSARSIQDVSPGSLPVSPAVTGAGSSPSLNAKKWISPHATGANPDVPPTGLIEVLRAEITALKNKTMEMEKEYLSKTQQCNKYKSELVQFRKQNDMSTEDIPSDEGIPAVFRSVPPSPGRQVRARRSTSTSSQRSMTSDKANVNLNAIPPLQLDNSTSTSTNTSTNQHEGSTNSTVSPQAIPDQGSSVSRSRSESTSSASGSLSRREAAARRISGGLFGLSSPPPQHPPHP
ncbi:hypothetical protein BDB00DRAFT_813177 [Zychaea mexicana]|uniref:uncharacterized protein n=1 Tax=Zychaea mexicana TaxID=64656 RepID=UPI0022FF4043|nr:uncharacterized protein BDB00DRAFT_813177 [Zychaea mexicana]KAI9495710.1 hypothetical protein BDB00DRAFT_813177 [Zychaea mexicana]